MKKLLSTAAVAASLIACAPGTSASAAGVPVPVPFGSSIGQLPPLPAPFVWDVPVPPAPPAPQFIASNWVEMYTGCPAPHQWAYTQNGTKVWCAQVARTDGYMWAPGPGPFTPPAGATFMRGTVVLNSLGAKDCSPAGVKAIDPSNGQEAYCEMFVLGPNPGLIWMYR